MDFSAFFDKVGFERYTLFCHFRSGGAAEADLALETDMKTVASITAHCRNLLECTEIPAVHKAVIRGKYETVEKLLDEAPFKARRCELFAEVPFQQMLQHAQLLHDRPSAAYAFSRLLQSSNALIRFLEKK